MLKLLILSVCLSQARSLNKQALLDLPTAASRSQLTFAIENNFDDTGPGAKGRELAYKTFNNLEEALINHISDPDTKLPDSQRDIAIRQLTGSQYTPQAIELSAYNKPIISFPRRPAQQIEFRSPLNFVREPLKQHYQGVRERPLNLAHYTKDPDVSETQEEYNPNPQYSFSYDIHDKQTGDSKAAHETRDGGVVRGYYTFVDAAGQRRTVRYTADDERGFQATVHTDQ
ncbi:uncharacterized protein LOC121725227 [Aricia agestis]|uniref:uncharacterized protein LOC121725227 n=1 Tax=Aricia agestis TaxID=91739 RepID=UPI001C206A31|nr:uncharacterized protein LOC121725227 [Aricia agestis]